MENQRMKPNTKPMKTIMKTKIIIPVVTIALMLLPSCTEKTTTSLKVLRDKAENHLVATAGEGKVALQLLHEQHAALREKLVSLTTWKTTFQRRLAESETAATQARERGDQAAATAHEKRAGLYRTKLAEFGDKDARAAAELAAFNESFNATKLEIQLLEEELAVHQAAAGLDDSLDPATQTQSRADRITELTESLRLKIDRAQAILQTSGT
jgi:hypothetical protein